MIKPLDVFKGLNCTINTTEDCNLRCKYCYEVNKNPKNIKKEDCFKFIDIILGDQSNWTERMKSIAKEGLVLDFIGGDSLMNWRLVDEVMEYFVYKVNVLNHPIKNRWRFMISSNGTLFTPEVQRFCEKWKEVLCLGVSIDGCPELHDMNRIFPDGRGSMSEIMKTWDWYRKTFPIESISTKSTLSKNSIPYIYKSLVFMHEVLGMKYIMQNFIMEDCGLTQEDLDLFDSEMEKCVNYIRQHDDDIYWSMIDKQFLSRKKPGVELPDEPKCGSGGMPCLSINGKIYPCFRWLPHTGHETMDFDCGDINRGLVADGFEIVSNGSKRSVCTKDPKCLDCEYEPCCSYCIGGCYAEYGRFERTTHICEIIKRQCRWAEEYWNGKNSKNT